MTAPDPEIDHPPRRVASDKRERILDAALDVFCEKTYGESRVPEIAKRAGVAAGTIYVYFPTKLSLVNEVYRQCKRLTAAYRYRRSEPMTVEEQFHEWFLQFCRFSMDHPRALEFLHHHFHAPYLDAESRAMEDWIDQSAIDFLDRGRAEGVIKDVDPRILMAMIVYLFAGLVRQLRADGQPVDAEHLAVGEQCAWDLLRGH